MWSIKSNRADVVFILYLGQSFLIERNGTVLEHVSIRGTKILQLFFYCPSSTFKDFTEEHVIHFKQELTNRLLRYLLGRFVDVVKMKETAVLLDMETVDRSRGPGARGRHSDWIFNYRKITVVIRMSRNQLLTAL